MKAKGSFGYTREERKTLKAFWQVTGATAGLLTLTAAAYIWPDALQEVLSVASVAAIIFWGIAVQDAWSIWRGH